MTLDEPAPLPDDRPRAGTVRSRLMLEVASELVGGATWTRRQARIDLRAQGPNPWDLTLVGSDGPWGVEEVVQGRSHVAIINPATAVVPTLRRLGEPADRLAAITCIPSYDQTGFAIRRDLGIETLEQLAARRPALTLSLRAQRDHSIQSVVEDALAAAGTSLADLESWGGRVLYHEDIPHRGERAEALASGEVDAVFDEGIYNWTGHAVAAGMRFVPPGDDAVRALERMGYRRATLRADRYEALDADVDTIDFSGFLVFTSADAPEPLVHAFCEAMWARRQVIPWQGGPHLPLDHMCRDEVDAPIPIPLHPAAAAFWEGQGVGVARATPTPS